MKSLLLIRVFGAGRRGVLRLLLRGRTPYLLKTGDFGLQLLVYR